MRCLILVVFGLLCAGSASAQFTTEPESYFDPLWQSLGVGQGFAWSVPTTPTIESTVLPAMIRDHRPLDGRVFILDPGHGGSDSGARYLVGGQRVTEAQLTLGTCLHVRDSLVALGARVVLTVAVPETLTWVTAAACSLPRQAAAVFNLPDHPAIDRQRSGLAQRLRVVDFVKQRWPAEEAIWISVHFNSVRGRSGRPQVRGAQFIYPAGQPRPKLAESLAEVFAGVRSLMPKRYYPLIPSGYGHGVKDLFVLRSEPMFVPSVGWVRNDTACAVFCELLNPRNSGDRATLSRPRSLHRLASLMTTAIRQAYAGP